MQLTEEFKKELETEKNEIEEARKFIESQPYRISPVAPMTSVSSTVTEQFISRFGNSPERSSVPLSDNKRSVLNQIQDELSRGEQILSSQSKFLREYVLANHEKPRETSSVSRATVNTYSSRSTTYQPKSSYYSSSSYLTSKRMYEVPRTKY